MTTFSLILSFTRDARIIISDCLKGNLKKISIHLLQDLSAKPYNAPRRGRQKQHFQIQIKTIQQKQLLHGTGERIKIQNPQSNCARERPLNAKRTRHWCRLRHNLSNIKTNDGPYHFYRIYKMQLLISLWKKYYLIVFLDHGVLRSAKGEKNP